MHKKEIDIPHHVAIVMDGNGRWGIHRKKERSFGHKEGLVTLRRILRAARELGVRAMTLYSFSTENWQRPASEVKYLMRLLAHFVDRDIAELKAEGVRVRVIGRRDDLSPALLRLVENAEESTRMNTAFDLIVAFNYGGRDEICRAAKKMCRDVQSGKTDLDDMDAKKFGSYLDIPDLPDPNLFIRTGGDYRVSNFLLWQLAYAELYFTPTLWPDFSNEEFEEAVRSYAQRDRRFGGLNDPTRNEEKNISAREISRKILSESNKIIQ